VNRAVLEGADAVLIGGCHLGDCHYLNGNYKARRRMVLLKNILETMGMEPGRIWVRWISASEGQKFADTVKEIVDETKKIGPNPMRERWDV
jgi:F420-non-reducing hydrogenase iron-sulfur subunit